MILTRLDWPNFKEKLEHLFFASFGVQIKPGYLDWRYFENFQSDLLFSVDVKDDQPMSSYSAFPVDLIVDGQKFRTATSMSTMTHPADQGKGRILVVAKELYEYAATQQYSGVWGFPNAKIHLLRNAKLGWSDIYEIPMMTLDISTFNSRKGLSQIKVNRDDKFSFEYPDAPSDGLIRVNRSRNYLIWRYALNPTNLYRNYVICSEGKVTSYLVTKLYGNEVDLVDIQAVTSDEARELLLYVVTESIVSGVAKLNCWAPTHHFVHAVLERIGFKNDAPVTYFGGRTLITSGVPSAWLDYRNWYVQMGDSDVY